jgi:hypothetical protein
VLQTPLLSLLVCAGAPAPARLPVDAATRDRVVGSLLDRLEKGYVFPDVAERVAASLRAKLAAGSYDALAEPEAFVRRLDEDVREVAHDGHLHVFYSSEVLPPSLPGAKPSAAEIAEARARMRPDLERFRPVEFRLEGHAGARHVTLAAEFNGWDRRELPMERRGGAWVASVDLEPGRYAYKFVVDDEWITDPANPRTVRAGPNENSLRLVDEAALTHAAEPPAARVGSR